MDIGPELQIQTVIKALTDVIVPALDPRNKLAQEQAGLVIGVLNIVAQRLPLMYRYERDELSRFLAFAGELQRQAAEIANADSALQGLVESVHTGSAVLDRAKADPNELRVASFDLREKIGALITQLYANAGQAQLKHIGTVVTGHAKEQLLRERAWLIGQGWEADPTAVPAIETLLSESG